MEPTPDAAIRAMVDRETRAWDARDPDLLVGIFHPDMVWAWPPDASAHDPATWVWGMGASTRVGGGRSGQSSSRGTSSLCDGEWKLVAHTGLLDYGP